MAGKKSHNKPNNQIEEALEKEQREMETVEETTEEAVQEAEQDVKEEQKENEPETEEISEDNKNSSKKESSEEHSKDKKTHTKVHTEIKKSGQFGLGHKKSKKSAIKYIFEDIWEVMLKFKNWVVKDYRKSIPILLGALLILVLVIAIVRNTIISGKLSKSQSQAGNGTESERELSEEERAAEIPLEENSYDYVNLFIQNYYNACQNGDVDAYVSMRSYTDETEKVRMQKKADYIEAYQNLDIYTKQGPVEMSYIVYVLYEVKFYNIDTLAPGLSTLYLCTNEEGELYVFSGEIDENATEYIRLVSTQDDVKDLFNKVTVTYKDAIDSDEVLRGFLDELAVNLKNDVGESIAGLVAENTEETGEEPTEDPVTVTEPEETGEDPVEEETAQTETVQTIEKVNIRGSASAEATKLGSAAKGERFVRYEELPNGWSRVDYNGQEAYIKTEYLVVVESATGTATALSSVNVRSQASENGSRLGVLSEGANVDVIEQQADGWTRVVYQGSVGYVKSEYLQMNE